MSKTASSSFFYVRAVGESVWEKLEGLSWFLENSRNWRCSSPADGKIGRQGERKSSCP
jgi:hypothetical protein